MIFLQIYDNHVALRNTKIHRFANYMKMNPYIAASHTRLLLCARDVVILTNFLCIQMQTQH